MSSVLQRSVETEQRAASLEQARLALETMARDLRAANPIDAIAPEEHARKYKTEVSFSVYCADNGVASCVNNLRPVTYRLVGNRFERVTREGTQILVGPSGPAGLAPDQQVGAVINPATESVFRYFKRPGTEVSTDLDTSPNQFRDCVKTVEISLMVRASKQGAPTRLTTRVDLRNWNEVSGCAGS
ncbi:MAG TPA: hypothetical protein VM345_01275 [Acidimicrobiales bacterium]|nr:hypothetical protein [Acidimicrobiales bacterium]